MVTGHVVVETRLALIRARAPIALELRGLARAADIVVLHASHTATLELTALQRERGRERGEKITESNMSLFVLLLLSSTLYSYCLCHRARH